MFEKGSTVKDTGSGAQAIIIWSNEKESRVVFITTGLDEVMETTILELVREPSEQLVNAVRSMSQEELDIRLNALRKQPAATRKRGPKKKASKKPLALVEVEELIKMKAAGTLHPKLEAELDKLLARAEELKGLEK